MNVRVNPQDLIRASIVDVHKEGPNEAIARHVLQRAGMSPAEIERSITTGHGLVAYDLQAPAKNLYPVETPIRNKIKRRGGGIGTATNWKAVTKITGSGFNKSPWVPEGQRSGRMSITTESKSAAFVTLGEEDQVTFEAISAGRTFEDLEATMSMRLLQQTMLKEEVAIVGGNKSLALGTCPTPTLAAGGAGATLPGAPTTYSVIVVALTYEGFMNSSLANGVATSMLITGADAETYTLNGGSSMKSAAAAQAITLGQALSCSVVVVSGAVAYAWYVGTAGNEKLEAITTINSVVFSAPLAGTGQAATAVTADKSRNADLAFDGLMTTAFAAGAANTYIKALATGVAGTGTKLTASGRGSCKEVDDMLQDMWDRYKLSPSVLYVSSQELRALTDVCLQGIGSSSLLQVYKTPEEAYGLTAGGTIQWYFNPFDTSGGQRIPILIHPDFAPGTIVGWCERLPLSYQSNNVPEVVEILERQGYYQIDWPLRTRRRERGVYVEQTLVNYVPFAWGIITNIAKP